MALFCRVRVLHGRTRSWRRWQGSSFSQWLLSAVRLLPCSFDGLDKLADAFAVGLFHAQLTTESESNLVNERVSYDLK